MNPDNRPAPRRDSDRPEPNANLNGIDAAFMSRWLERPVPADRITEAIVRQAPAKNNNPVDPAVFTTLKTEVLRRIRAMSDRFAGGLPDELRCVLSSVIIPHEFRRGNAAIPNKLADPPHYSQRKYSICCHLRNAAGQYLVYHHGGGFAFSREYLPGESESPAAVNLFSVELTHAEHNLFLAKPRSFRLNQTTFCNRPAFREQLDHIVAGHVLSEHSGQFEPPAWSELKLRLKSFVGATPGKEELRIERIRRFAYASEPGEFVCETNYGAVWVRVTLSETTRPFESEFFVRWEVDAVRKYIS